MSIAANVILFCFHQILWCMNHLRSEFHRVLSSCFNGLAVILLISAFILFFVLCDLFEHLARCKRHKYCEKGKSNVLDRACLMTIP